MAGEEYLVQELKKYCCICYYPSSGTDLSNIDFFGSGKKLWEERTGGVSSGNNASAETSSRELDPDLFIHTDINFYQEFASGLEMSPKECGIHGSCEVLGFRELPALPAPNEIYDNFTYSGKCFEYKLRVWGSSRIKTLLYCLCENEYFVSRILLAHGIQVPLIWSRNWAGGQTYGTWLANVLDRLHTAKVYTDWLCVPGRRGEPRNRLVEEKYSELMTSPRVRLVRNDDIHWIDEGSHGWVEEYDVLIQNGTI
ncbi:MAG TPA: hypothetical protein PKM25_09720 [Candidatus Ozemobacteraceae bacterium]|nr:hypothetical protein [Candidatus Ozemobacteraceae bacterium]